MLISIGGWTYSKFFSDAAATPASREKLVRSCVDIYIKGQPAHVQRRRRTGQRGRHLRRHRPRLGVAGVGGAPWQPRQPG
ncbi:hypothetical protein ACTMTJ_29275 [Phytohabitans sp. LJ34]|uniref:hypothetical protein n=1 Tax=Phytohabitans sp. LJ34 TaxID=3452217 RepID=UPI003F8A3689